MIFATPQQNKQVRSLITGSETSLGILPGQLPSKLQLGRLSQDKKSEKSLSFDGTGIL